MSYKGSRNQFAVPLPGDEKLKIKILKPFNEVIQVCPNCRKVDVCKGDGHTCDYEWQMEREYSNHYDD